MRHTRPGLVLLFLLPLLLCTASTLLLCAGAPRSTLAETARRHAATPTDADRTAPMSAMPVAFVPNVGQWDHPARHVVRLGAMTVLLQENGWMFTLSRSDKERTRGVAVCMTLAEPGTAELVAEQRLCGEHNYFLGNDPARWRTGVPRFGQVRYKAPWPGADVVCYAQHGRFEYDLVLAPHADLARMEIEVEGAERLWIDGDGALVIDTAMGPVRQPKPVTWEVGSSGERRPLAAAHELRGASRFGFTAPGWSGERELVLDPGLVYSTFVGGQSSDRAEAVSTDASGVVTIAGGTSSSPVTYYPTTPGAWNTSHNGGLLDVFVSRLDPSLPAAQQLIWSTFVGGSGTDTTRDLSVDASGAVTITGSTQSANYPTTPGAFDTTYGGGIGDAFVTRLDPSLPAAQQLVYSTFLGGTGGDEAHGLRVDASGVVTVAGVTGSADFPTTPGAFDTTWNGHDAFVTRLDPSLPAWQQLVYSTFVGGSSSERASALSTDVSGVVTITGWTNSTDYPTTPAAFDTTHNGSDDVFVTRLDPSLPAAQQLAYSTFVGGTTSNGDLGFDVWVDASGVATITGVAGDGNFPTTPGAFDTTHNGYGDVFVTRLDPSRPAAQQLVYSTFLGGSGGWDWGIELACEPSGVVTVAGHTDSPDYPTTPGAFDRTLGFRDAFVTRLDPARSGAQQLVYSTFVGGSGNDWAWALALDASGGVTIAGAASSLDYPTTPGAFDTIWNGGEDVFVTRLDMLPTGVAPFGRSSPGCAGPLPISVTSMPSVGNTGFAITCGNAPPNGIGLLLAGGAGLAAPINVFGVELWIDPNPFLVTFAVTSNGVGAAEFALPIPGSAGLVGTRLFTQFAWLSPASPPPCPPLGISASGALDITIQP